ncbi:MAG: D-Ala-D-Ala carboxypeptidase family metallohydrolase [Gemmatimonadaceae bacterium]|jgi:hypothetical protein|nr:D-Ala-D-Ala carboxypeptidase family metallohydrolase [Gemmatimonadaceae bacterium]
MRLIDRLRQRIPSRRARLFGAAACVIAASAVTAAPAAHLPSGVSPDLLGDSLVGTSGKLRARFVPRTRSFAIPILRTLFGESPARMPGVYRVALSGEQRPFSFITMRPFADKVNGRIGAYRIGFWPDERRWGRTEDARRLPAGFIEVTPENRDTPVSEHFALAEFLTHDQGDVWPKYLVLQERLLDKLELVIAELRASGARVDRLQVMSGFRTPQYNRQGVGSGGRASDSRHQYGDAADVYVVNGSRDWMADLDGDGRGDMRDARLLAQAAERVEQRHPDLAGGIGIYQPTSAHGPFVHIDARGVPARWGAW